MKNVRNEDILTCWKEIADYLERSIRTCQRWTRHRRLPVSFPAGPGSSPHASRSALDAWRLGQGERNRIPVIPIGADSGQDMH